MQTRNEARANIKNDLSFSIAQASIPNIFPTEIGSPLAGGGVLGRVRQYTPKINEAIAAAWNMYSELSANWIESITLLNARFAVSSATGSLPAAAVADSSVVSAWLMTTFSPVKIRQPSIAQLPTIQPIVPNTRTIGNSLSPLFRCLNERLAVKPSVGMKQSM